jgi:hypothetical protein
MREKERERGKISKKAVFGFTFLGPFHISCTPAANLLQINIGTKPEDLFLGIYTSVL